MRAGAALVELGESFERIAAARARRWPVSRLAPDPEAEAVLQRVVEEEEPVVRRLRETIGAQLTGLPHTRYGRHGARTLVREVAEAEPLVLVGSTSSQIKPHHHLVPRFHIKVQPRRPGMAQAPYLHLHLLAGQEESRSPKRESCGPWWLHYGFTCFESHDRPFSPGHLTTLRRVARHHPERLLEAIALLRDTPAPGRLVLAPNMNALGGGMRVETADEVVRWLEGPAPGLIRRIDAASGEAAALAAMDDRDLVEQVGRFLRVCAIHFLAPAWERARLTAETSVFISYRRKDFSEPVAHRVREQLEAEGISAFLDVHDLLPADKWQERLEHLIEGTHVFLALVGPDYFGRMLNPPPGDEPDYVERELGVALKLRHEPMGFALDGGKVPPRAALPQQVRRIVEYNIRPIETRDPDLAARIVCEHLADRLRDR
jgi:hypothetical protein